MTRTLIKVVFYHLKLSFLHLNPPNNNCYVSMDTHAQHFKKSLQKTDLRTNVGKRRKQLLKIWSEDNKLVRRKPIKIEFP